MNLTEELDKKRAGAPDFISADHLKAMGGATRDLRSTGIVGQALSEGSQAPAFALPNGHGETIDVGALMERGAVVLNFYRGGWCPYCNLELKAYQARLGEMRGLGAELVAISPETPDKAALTEARERVDFEVLSDVGNSVARQFGLVFELPADIYDIYTNTFGFDIEEYNADKSHELPIPATYVIGKGGKVLLAYVDADYSKRLDPGDVIAALKSGA